MCQALLWVFGCGHTIEDPKKNWCPDAVRSGQACQPLSVMKRETSAQCTACSGRNGLFH